MINPTRLAHRRSASWSAALLACAFALALTGSRPKGAAAANFVVCASGCPFSTIGAAVAAAPAGSTILVLPGTYKERLTIGKSLTIAGLPPFEAKTIIDGNGKGQTITVTAGTVQLVWLTIRGGAPGGESGGTGIFNYKPGRVSLVATAVEFNNSDFGGGVINYGTMTITDSTVSRNNGRANSGAGAGGIYNAGTLHVTNSTINHNIGLDGGGILNDKGNVVVTGSTISHNSVIGFGGGVYTNYGSFTINNSTVTYNSTSNVGDGGGIYTDFGPVTLNSTDVSNNTPNDCSGPNLSC